jgi:eukaryotic-like serine/threonine-protein kinase
MHANDLSRISTREFRAAAFRDFVRLLRFTERASRMPSTSPVESGRTPEVGEVVSGKYRLEKSLASGGMGILMLASQIGLGRRVVVKFLREEAAPSEEVTARFLREARTAATLHGDHIVRVVDVGALPSGSPYFVMEHLDGCDLSDELEATGPLPMADAVHWILQACEALAEAHARGIVHRDIKPSNLFLAKSPDGSRRLKVLDFGISKALPEPGDRPLTATRAVLGTPDYMSPEQIRDFRNVDARSDVWSLGVVLYEVLSSKRPFEAPNAAGLCVAIATEAPIPLGKRRSGIPKMLESVVHRCMKKDPSERFSSIAEFARALLPFATESSRQSMARIDAIAGTENHAGASRNARRSARREARTDPFEWPSGAPAREFDGLSKPTAARTRAVVGVVALGFVGAVAYFGWRGFGGEPASVTAPDSVSVTPTTRDEPAAVAPGIVVSPEVTAAPSTESARAETESSASARARPSAAWEPVRAPRRPQNVLDKKAFSDRK